MLTLIPTFMDGNAQQITISQECYDNIMKAFSLLMEEAQYVVNCEAMTDCDRTYCQEGLQYSEAALKELNKYKKQ